MARFQRALKPSLVGLLEPGGWLAPLANPRRIQTRAGTLGVHLQLRERGRVTLYCGSALLLEASLSPTTVRFALPGRNPASEASAQLLREWRVGESGLEEAISAYLTQAHPSVVKEGLVQALWHATTEPWATFDHEAAFGYPSVAARTHALDLPELALAETAAEARTAEDTARWNSLPARPVRNNRDQLAIDRDGHLVVVELKHAGSGHGLYYGPLQLLRYLHEDSARLAELLPAFERLVAQKRRMGLLVTQSGNLHLPVRPVLAWGLGMPSAEVLRRTRLMLNLANEYVPPNTLPIEVWHQPNGRPRRWG